VHHHTRVACLLLLGCACGSKSDSKSDSTDKSVEGSVAPGDPARSAPGFEGLTVTVNGKPVGMLRGFIKRVSPDHWRIQVGDLEGSCAELLSGVTTAQKGATSFVATLAKQVAPDGSESTVITEFWSAGHPTKTALGGIARVGGPTDKDTKVELVLPKVTDVNNGKTMVVGGTFTALGCGDQPARPGDPGIPNDPHVSAAVITVAGKRLDVHSAIVRGSDVVLSTGPKDCSTVTPFAPIVIAHADGKWQLSGTWIKQAQTATDTMKDIKFKIGATGTGLDGPTAALTLDGAGTIGGYPVKFEGTIEALDCPE
jgi:hypothetical protein